LLGCPGWGLSQSPVLLLDFLCSHPRRSVPDVKFGCAGVSSVIRVRWRQRSYCGAPGEHSVAIRARTFRWRSEPGWPRSSSPLAQPSPCPFAVPAQAALETLSGPGQDIACGSQLVGCLASRGWSGGLARALNRGRSSHGAGGGYRPGTSAARTAAAWCGQPVPSPGREWLAAVSHGGSHDG